MMLTRCPDETMVAGQACGGEAGVWRRGIGMAQASGLKGRSGHGEDEAAPGLVSIDVADAKPVTKRPPLVSDLRLGKKNRCKSSQRLSHFPPHAHSRPPAARELRRNSQPAGRHASVL